MVVNLSCVCSCYALHSWHQRRQDVTNTPIKYEQKGGAIPLIQCKHKPLEIPFIPI